MRFNNTQRGAVLIVMLVIFVLGTAALMLNALGRASVHIERDKKTADALAQAKDALIARSVSDFNRPGSLPCPDALTDIAGTNVPNDGIADLLVGNDCPSYAGRLPWKTLGLPDLRDGSGEGLWYVLSRNFRDDNSNHINSETLGTLAISGAQNIINIAALIVAPGAPICGRGHDTNNVTQYLEAISSATATSAIAATASNDCPIPAAAYNDTLLAITAPQLIQPVEMRIAREAKSCLDNYALANSHKYPWASDLTDSPFSYSTPNSLFGKLPKHPTIADSRVRNMIDSIDAFQTAVTNCVNNVGNQATLESLGGTLESNANNVAGNQPTLPNLSTTITNPAAIAGDKAKDHDVTCSNIQANPTANAIQIKLNSAIGGLVSQGLYWTSQCALLSSTNDYWSDWKNQVFYQVDEQYRPGGALGTPSITMNENGTYRAVVVVARSPLTGQVRNPVTIPPTGYLEGGNAHTSSTPNTNFIANRPGAAEFANVNDLVLCLDGGSVNCK